MNNLEPTIRIDVDLTNPGQFFACCGLLELAGRLWRDSCVLGKFARASFELLPGSPERSLRELIDHFVRADVQQLDLDDNAASPLYLRYPFDLRLDWWSKPDGPGKTSVDLGGGGQLKPWAGKQFGPLIFRLMRNACHDIDLLKPFDQARAVYDQSSGKAKKKAISPFYFDARREETSLDLGFSSDDQEMSVMAFPAVESLALVGLQRFRPAVDGHGVARSFLYTAWQEPLPLVVAMAAVSGMVPARACGTFRFTKPSRGGEYLTMFSRATRDRKTHA